MLNKVIVEARDLPDLWFQAIYNVLQEGRRFVIDRGSYAGQTRLEFDYFMGHVKFPGTRPLLPEMPPTIDIPAPVEEAYVFGGEGYERSYIEYLMTATKQPGESYTYGSRLAAAEISKDDLMYKRLNCEFDIVQQFEFNCKEQRYAVHVDRPHTASYNAFLNQIEYIIYMYKTHGHRNNQLVLQIAQPTDLLLVDPPCLRSIDTRIQDGKLHFIIYFRSWDLWGGLPANLAGIQTLKEYMASEIGVDDGEMIVESKGLHLYGYAEDLAKLRCMVDDLK